MLCFTKSGLVHVKVSAGELGFWHSLHHASIGLDEADKRRKKRADEIFSIGIARNAQPLSRLKSRHAAFLQRILVTSSAAIPDDEPLPPAAGAHRTPARSILGQVSTAPMSVSGATQLAPANRLSKATNGMKMEVFSDDAGRKVEDGVPGEWADFGTRDGRRKENVVEATSWKGETMPVAGKVAPRTPKVEVFRDTVSVSISGVGVCRTA